MKTYAEDPLSPSIVLGVGAHPDDLDFMAGGTIAQLVLDGCQVYYLILTDGSNGTSDHTVDPATLVRMREDEQCAAATILGVQEVNFLRYKDGNLEVTTELKRDIVKHIRSIKPDIVIATDPTMYYAASRGFINHPDHRAGGEAVIDSVFPLARDHLAYPELLEAGLEPHNVKTLLLSNFTTADYFVDINRTIDKKLQTIFAHQSQVPDKEQVESMIREYAGLDGEVAGYRYAEGFVRIEVR